MVERGMKLAEKYGITYKYIECYLDDFLEINKRLKGRQRMVSQISEIQSEEDFQVTINSAKKPANYRCLVINTGQPLANYIEDVIHYINCEK